jgi:hypothetical protein
MSSRALRKAQRQLEEEQAIVVSKKLDESDEEEEEQRAPVNTKSAFALLNQEEEESDEDEDNDADVTEAPKQQAPAEVKPLAKSGKKKKKKKKGKAVDASKDTGKVSATEDDFDAAILSLAASKPKSTDASSGGKDTGKPSNSKVEGMRSLLSISTQHLHVRNEMRQLFGREALDVDRRPAQEPRRRGQRGAPQAAGQGFPALSLRRNIFITGKEEWPRATTGGLGMEIVPNSREDGTVEFRFVHSTAYRDAQRQYEIAVASMDPQRLVVLMQQNPYHIATLLQISEIAKHEGSHAESGDFLERALFSFGRAVHSTFAHHLSQGKARLDFKRPENRELFLAIWRYTQNLTMRSTWRTVYEWAKMLLSIAPHLDPYRMELVLDQYALRARQPQHYLDLIDTKFFESSWHAEHIPWSISLAYIQTEQAEKARDELRHAIETQPWLCVRLYKELDLDPIPPALWSYHEPPTPRHILFVEMYCSRAKELWNTPEAKSLLTAVAGTANPTIDATTWRGNTTVAEARHIYLTQNDNFVRLLSACAEDSSADTSTEQFNHEDLGRSPNTDPFPPKHNIVSYDPTPVFSTHGAGALDSRTQGLARGGTLEQLVQEIARLQMMNGEGHEGERENNEFNDDEQEDGDELEFGHAGDFVDDEEMEEWFDQHHPPSQ